MMPVTLNELVHIHPHYSDFVKAHDVALLELEDEVRYTKSVYPICLETELQDPSAADKLFVTGWGQVSLRLRNNSKILLKAQLDIVPLSKCIIAYGVDRRSLNVGHLCAHDPGLQKDACHGDSGGPLNLIVDERKRQYRVVGVIAAGFECASSVPGLYTRVAAQLDFIEPIVWPDL